MSAATTRTKAMMPIAENSPEGSSGARTVRARGGAAWTMTTSARNVSTRSRTSNASQAVIPGLNQSRKRLTMRAIAPTPASKRPPSIRSGITRLYTRAGRDPTSAPTRFWRFAPAMTRLTPQRSWHCEPAGDAPQRRLDVIGLVADLGVGEAQHGEPCGGKGLVADPVARLLHRRSVIAKAVGLDDESELRPIEVDPNAGEPPLRGGRRQAGTPSDGKKSPFQLGLGEAEGRAIEDAAEPRGAVDAASVVDEGSETFRINEIELVGV